LRALLAGGSSGKRHALTALGIALNLSLIVGQ